MKIKRKLTEYLIEHPTFPEVKVKVKKLSRLQALSDYSEIDEKGKIHRPLKDPDTGEYLRDDEGRIQTEIVQRFDGESILEMLKKTVVGWEGITDEDGNDIPFSFDSLEVLFAEELDTKNEAGETMSFWAYILDEIGKRNSSTSVEPLDPK